MEMTEPRPATSEQAGTDPHAAALIDHPNSHLFEVTMHDGRSRVQALHTRSTKHTAVWTLGYRPSDVLQANCVIWVEGPSDRLYLNWWLKAWLAQHRPTLHVVEGVDYHIMTYGGRLLAHFTATDRDELDDALIERDLIALQSLGRRLAIVIDSDKHHHDDTINATKTRVAREIAPDKADPTNGVAWITAGRQIENYLAHERLDRALKDAHPRMLPNVANPWDRYDPLPDNIIKVDVATKVTASPAGLGDLAMLDLNERLEELVAFIAAQQRHAGRDVRHTGAAT